MEKEGGILKNSTEKDCGGNKKNKSIKRGNAFDMASSGLCPGKLQHAVLGIGGLNLERYLHQGSL